MQVHGIPIDGLGHEGAVGESERGHGGVEGWQHRATGVGVGGEPHPRGGRGLLFCEAVDGVVEHHHGHVHVVADGMDPVASADGAAVAVARGDEHVQVWTAGLDSTGGRQGPSVQAVETIRAHVVGEATGAADP